MGVLAIPESRDTIKKISNPDMEKKIDNIINKTKGVVLIGGVAATVVLAIVPVDGPFGEFATLLATPFFVKQVEKLREPLKTLFLKEDGTKIPVANFDTNGSTMQSVIDKDLVAGKESGKVL